MHRQTSITFYFALTEDFRVYRFVPHVATLLYDLIDNLPEVSGHTVRARIGAYFRLAQKLMDTKILTIDDMAQACVVTPDTILQFEAELYCLLLDKHLHIETSPDHALHNAIKTKLPNDVNVDDVCRFFDTTLYLNYPLETRIQACVLFMQEIRSPSPVFDAPVDVTMCVAHLCACYADISRNFPVFAHLTTV